MTAEAWLLDTHALLWLLYDDPRLSKKAVSLAESDAVLFYSTVSFWEIALKRSGPGFDFEIEDDWDQFLPEALKSSGIMRLDIEASDCRQSETLPLHHRDPFDRLLIAQCQTRKLGAVTKDKRWSDYELPCLW